jgi:hypothetical protein
VSAAGVNDGKNLVATMKRLREHLGPWEVHNVSMVTDVVAIVGLFGVIASVFLLFFQTRANVQQAKISNDQAKVSNNIARATVISNSSSNLHQVFQIFIERPELWPYFYESKDPPLRGHKRVRINVVAETLGDIFEDGLVAHSLIPTSRSSGDWVRYCRLVLTVSPIMNEIMQSNPDWWPELRKATSDVVVVRHAGQLRDAPARRRAFRWSPGMGDWAGF